MTEIVIEAHRRKIPIDHPDGSVTPEKLSFVTWKKVFETEITDTSTEYVIDGLDGDKDKIYKIVFYGYLAPTSPDNYLVVIPNGVSASFSNLEHYASYDGSTTGHGYRLLDLDGFLLSRTGWGSATKAIAIGYLNAETGLERIWRAISHTWVYGKASNAQVVYDYGCFWNDSSTKITSLKIYASAGFNGKIMLFGLSR